MQMRWLPRRTVAAGSLGFALILGGCVSPAFRESVAQFGTLTKATATQQNDRLARIVAADHERYRQQLAELRVDLRPSETCGRVDDPQPSAPARAGETGCRLLPLGTTEVREPDTYPNIVALNLALADYAEALSLLAADNSGEQTAFTTSVTKLATSLGGLEKTIRTTTGAPASNFSTQLGAIAAVVSRLGNLYFGARRNEALREIIRNAGPIVDEAIRLLTRAQASISVYEQAALLTRLNNARRRATDAVNSGSTTAQIRIAQDELFNAVAALNHASVDQRRTEAVGHAHRKLVQAAQEHATAEDLRQAILALADLASATHGAVTAVRN